MPFTSVGSIADAIEAGHVHEQVLYKTGSPTLGSAGRCYDLSMGAGIPRYNAYVGTQLEFTPLVGSGNVGIYTGEDDPSRTKYLTKIMLYDVSTNKYPGVFILCDYLGFYPLVDGDSVDTQDLTTGVSVPRLSSKGAQVMLVSSVPQTSGLAVVATIVYTNQDGTTGRSTTCRLDSASVLGEVINCEDRASGAAQAQRFLSLANGDTGVRAVESVTLNNAAGGFFSVVLVDPLIEFAYNQAGTATEYEVFQTRGRTCPITSGAYLNFILQATVGGSGIVAPRGLLTFTRA